MIWDEATGQLLTIGLIGPLSWQNSSTNNMPYNVIKQSQHMYMSLYVLYEAAWQTFVDLKLPAIFGQEDAIKQWPSFRFVMHQKEKIQHMTSMGLDLTPESSSWPVIVYEATEMFPTKKNKSYGREMHERSKSCCLPFSFDIGATKFSYCMILIALRLTHWRKASVSTQVSILGGA